MEFVNEEYGLIYVEMFESGQQILSLFDLHFFTVTPEVRARKTQTFRARKKRRNCVVNNMP